MSRHTISRVDRMAQMSKQEELIAKKRQEILEKQRTAELAKQVAAAQNSVSGKFKANEIKDELISDLKPKAQNSFCNDGSFLTHFKKILDAAKRERDDKQEKVRKENQSDSSKESECITTIEQQLITPEAPTVENQNSTESVEQQPNNVAISQLSPVSQITLPQHSSVNIHQEILQPDLTQPPPPPPPPTTNYINLTTNSYSTPPPSTSATKSNFTSAPFFNPNIPPPIITTPAPPPPPPPPTLPVYLIPPPEPLKLSSIPPPKELDLTAIPDPEINLNAIKVPTEEKKVFSDNNEQFLPPTLESLIALVAEKGDAYEDYIRTRKNDVHPSLW